MNVQLIQEQDSIGATDSPVIEQSIRLNNNDNNNNSSSSRARAILDAMREKREALTGKIKQTKTTTTEDAAAGENITVDNKNRDEGLSSSCQVIANDNSSSSVIVRNNDISQKLTDSIQERRQRIRKLFSSSTTSNNDNNKNNKSCSSNHHHTPSSSIDGSEKQSSITTRSTDPETDISLSSPQPQKEEQVVIINKSIHFQLKKLNLNNNITTTTPPEVNNNDDNDNNNNNDSETIQNNEKNNDSNPVFTDTDKLCRPDEITTTPNQVYNSNSTTSVLVTPKSGETVSASPNLDIRVPSLSPTTDKSKKIKQKRHHHHRHHSPSHRSSSSPRREKGRQGRHRRKESPQRSSLSPRRHRTGRSKDDNGKKFSSSVSPSPHHHRRIRTSQSFSEDKVQKKIKSSSTTIRAVKSFDATALLEDTDTITRKSPSRTRDNKLSRKSSTSNNKRPSSPHRKKRSSSVPVTPSSNGTSGSGSGRHRRKRPSSPSKSRSNNTPASDRKPAIKMMSMADVEVPGELTHQDLQRLTLPDIEKTTNKNNDEDESYTSRSMKTKEDRASYIEELYQNDKHQQIIRSLSQHNADRTELNRKLVRGRVAIVHGGTRVFIPKSSSSDDSGSDEKDKEKVDSNKNTSEVSQSGINNETATNESAVSEDKSLPYTSNAVEGEKMHADLATTKTMTGQDNTCKDENDDDKTEGTDTCRENTTETTAMSPVVAIASNVVSPGELLRNSLINDPEKRRELLAFLRADLASNKETSTSSKQKKVHIVTPDEEESVSSTSILELSDDSSFDDDCTTASETSGWAGSVTESTLHIETSISEHHSVISSVTMPPLSPDASSPERCLRVKEVCMSGNTSVNGEISVLSEVKEYPDEEKEAEESSSDDDDDESITKQQKQSYHTIETAEVSSVTVSSVTESHDDNPHEDSQVNKNVLPIVKSKPLFVTGRAADALCKANGGHLSIARKSGMLYLEEGGEEIKLVKLDVNIALPTFVSLSTDFRCGTYGSLYDIALRSGCDVHEPLSTTRRRRYPESNSNNDSTSLRNHSDSEHIRRPDGRNAGSSRRYNKEDFVPVRGGLYDIALQSGLTKESLHSRLPISVTTSHNVCLENEYNTTGECSQLVISEDVSDWTCGANGTLAILKDYPNVPVPPYLSKAKKPMYSIKEIDGLEMLD